MSRILCLAGACATVLFAACPADKKVSPGDTDTTVTTTEETSGDTPECVPQCAGRECGTDLCGGICGTCETGEICGIGGLCRPDDLCVAQCAGRECGDNGCGGTCGDCPDPARPFCDQATFTCSAGCVPDCVAKTCGDDGCGGTCGECPDGHGCSPVGHCVPEAWACEPHRYDAGDACDCGCGAPDPDCQQRSLALLGCEPFDRCDGGTCVPRVPAAWTCADAEYDDGRWCHCECGAVDPDCALFGVDVLHCGQAETCGPAGTCAPCVADCEGRVCGSDGCGGTCGDAPCPESASVCVHGTCVAGCEPTPILCETNVCGDDGCGGSCGTCPPNSLCDDGQCRAEPGMSCAGSCRTQAPGGCWCDETCVGRGDCCPDFVALCVCQPDCDGRTCGDDGCGDTCGSCGEPDAPYCSPAGTCQATCTPRCDGRCGDDGCGGQCPACPGGGACNEAGTCVPPTWVCAPSFYADGTLCDCGCGAPDPDCEEIGLTWGCPLEASCGDDGLCDIAFCAREDDCTRPRWCFGHYLTGGGRRRGVCQAPDPSGGLPGAPCASDYACATGLCAAGLCRSHCSADGDCATAETCVGMELSDGLTSAPIGIVTVCDGSAKIQGGTCARQLDCTAPEVCLAFIEPAALAPRHACGKLSAGAGDENDPCETTHDCELGLICAANACVRPCPGGQTDCPATATCGTAVLHHGASISPADDALVDVCVPE